MEQLYLEFDERELENNSKLFFEIFNRKNRDIENTFIEFADEYMKGKMSLAVFLQVVNLNIQSYQHVNRGIAHIERLLPAILNIKDYYNKKNEKVPADIYELLICIYNSKYDKESALLTSKELLSIDKENKVAKMSLASYEEEKEKSIQNFSTEDLAILNNRALFYSNNEKYKDIDKSIKYNKYIINIMMENENYYYDIIGKYNINLNNCYYIYVWNYFGAILEPYLPIAQSNLGICYYHKYKKDKNIENYRNAEKLYKESIKNYIEFSKKYGRPQQYIKDPIINLANLYYEEKKFEEAHKLVNEYFYLLPIDSDYYRLIGNCIYRENPCKETAKKSLESLKNSIRELNFIDPASFEYAMIDAFNTIMLMYEMKEKKHIPYDAVKESLNQLYVYNAEKPNFNLQALPISFKINDYELCSKIALYIIKNYPIEEKIVLEYLIISLHRLNEDNSYKLLKIFNEKDFNNYEYIIKLINECSKSEVLNKSVKINNKKVLIDIYEIMSVSREELIVMRLFDYIRNADAYANMKINNDTEELETDRIARWKGENVEIKNEYILCYHFHSSSEIQYKKDEYGNFQLNEKGEKIPIRISVRGERRKTIWRKFPAENWIAVNQIRDTLAHRINENDTDVNEAVRTTKKAREFIEANFISIIECLFNVIKENGLLTDEKFNSEDF